MPNIGSSNRALVPSAELNLGGTATTEKQFTDSTTAATRLILYAPGSGVLDKRSFRVRAWGRCLAGTAGNLTVALYWGTSATIGSNTKVCTTGAIAMGTTPGGNWLLETQMVYDSASQRIEGLMKGFIHATALAQVINTAAATSVDLTTATTSEGQGFTITGTFSAGNASNTAYVDGFELIAD
jgi:hypothetical protein